ncbi:major facilitator superfamily protein [Luminiphilus syltensis NOR5-1B]|uniref:Major facilitator superfamily protein n=1 Tax=Luminiphilus syltensis NOR5-1B TaxID=565045 RepID=B8KTP0_9GAMM|nr:tetracycline resistance MFS efflux pump [Luminiphilus syltensis]EED34109.1 major facilitator superfamily protein [Luminiphilus syltensis NOR5-1B]
MKTGGGESSLALWLVFVVVVIDLIGFGIIIPILPFLAPKLGGNAVDIAAIIVVFSLCGALVTPLWGRLSDRIGRKPVLMICLTGGALAYAMLGFADELWMVYLARAFAGVCSGNLPVATALMADLSPPHRRARAMGLIGTAFGLGLILGPVVGGVLAGEQGDFRVPCLFAGFSSLLAVILGSFLIPREPRNDSGKRDGEDTPAIKVLSSVQLLARDRSQLLVAQYILHTAAVTGALYLYPLWSAAMLDWGPREVGVFYGVVGIAMVLVQGVLIGPLTTRFGVLPVLKVGMVVFAGSVLAAVFADEEWLIVTAGFLAFSGSTVCVPILNTVTSLLVSTEERGQMMGITASGAAVGRVLGPLVTGFVLSVGGFPVGWLAVLVPILLILYWAVTDAKRFARFGMRDSEPVQKPSPGSADGSGD